MTSPSTDDTAKGSAGRVGILVAQLGTPEAPTAAALRPYLRQFLSDPRVIDLHPLKWLPILYLMVLTRRPRRSARLYQRVWTPQGSPLLIHSRSQERGLQDRLGDRYRVILGMRYGNPSIDAAMATFAREGVDRILLFPMFPQFSCATTGSVYDGVNRAAFGRRCRLFFDRRRRMPTLRTVPPYYDHPAYIDSLKAVVEETVKGLDSTPDLFLFTFHGIPKRYVDEGDPYAEQCQITARLLAASLGLGDDRWTQTFQSRFGREEWLQPYTEDVLRQLGGRDVRRLVVACPGFTADCLETLDEIGREGMQQFQQGGGLELHLASCVNGHPVWLNAMAEIARQETAGWVS